MLLLRQLGRLHKILKFFFIFFFFNYNFTMTIKNIFGIKESPKTPEFMELNKNSYQIENYHDARVVWTQEFYAKKVFVGDDNYYQLMNIFGTNPQTCWWESTTEFLRVGVGETAGTCVIGWDDADTLRLGVYSSPTDTTIVTHMTISSAGTVDVVNALTAGSISSDTNISTNGGIIYSTTQNVQLLPAGTSFTITSNTVILTGDVGLNSVTDINGFKDGQLLTIRFVDLLVTLVNGGAGNLRLQGGVNLVSAPNLIVQLVYTNNLWYEVSRCQT